MSRIFKAVDSLVVAAMQASEAGGLPTDVLKEMQDVIDDLSLVTKDERDAMEQQFRAACEPGSLQHIFCQILFTASEKNRQEEDHLADY